MSAEINRQLIYTLPPLHNCHLIRVFHPYTSLPPKKRSVTTVPILELSLILHRVSPSSQVLSHLSRILSTDISFFQTDVQMLGHLVQLLIRMMVAVELKVTHLLDTNHSPNTGILRVQVTAFPNYYTRSQVSWAAARQPPGFDPATQCKSQLSRHPFYLPSPGYQIPLAATPKMAIRFLPIY